MQGSFLFAKAIDLEESYCYPQGISRAALPSFAESHGCKPVDECEVGTLRSLGEGGYASAFAVRSRLRPTKVGGFRPTKRVERCHGRPARPFLAEELLWWSRLRPLGGFQAQRMGGRDEALGVI